MECTGFPLSVARLPLTKRSVALRPRLAASLPLSQRRSASACEESYTCERGVYMRHVTKHVRAPRKAPNFLELRKGEVRRIPLLRTRVNKDEKRSRSTNADLRLHNFNGLPRPIIIVTPRPAGLEF